MLINVLAELVYRRARRDRREETGGEDSKSMTTTTTVDKRRALGRGLESLLPVAPRTATAPPPPVTGGAIAVQPKPHKPADGDILEVALDLIDSNPYQTRGIFRE